MARPAFDPTALPIASISGDAAIDPCILTPEWLRRCFASPNPWQPEITAEQNFFNIRGEPTPAAVLVPVVVRGGELTVLFTERTAHLTDHAGQVSFPGGRVETGDASAIETALRETEEETGLARRHIEIIGQLPDYFTGTGFQVASVAGLVTPPFDLVPDTFEVAEVFEVPLWFLMNPANHQRRSVVVDQGVRSFYTMPYQKHFIWGATAAILRNLYCFLAAQPVLDRASMTLARRPEHRE